MATFASVFYVRLLKELLAKMMSPLEKVLVSNDERMVWRSTKGIEDRQKRCEKRTT
jgi:hypothetical protein